MIKKYNRAFVYCFISLIISSIAGVIMVTAAYSLPIEKIRENTIKSLNYIYITPEYLNYGIIKSKPDYFTDITMLNIASLWTASSPFYAALAIPRFNFYHYIDLNLAVSLRSDIALPKDNLADYQQYWHGYLTVLKPILLFFDINKIRIANYGLQVILLLAVLWLFYKRLGITYALAFLFAVMVISPVTTGFCLQYSDIYYILLISMIFMLKNCNGNLWKIFFWAGVATAFFDFFTYPLVPFGFLLITSLLMYNNSFFEIVKNSIGRAGAWICGYAGMWFSKWVIASIFTEENVIAIALEKAIYRTKGMGKSEIPGLKDWSSFTAIKFNFDFINNPRLWVTLAIFTGAILLLNLLYKKKFVLSMKSFSILAVAFLPIVWFAIVSEHSIVHPYIVYRNLSISAFAILAALGACFTQKKAA